MPAEMTECRALYTASRGEVENIYCCYNRELTISATRTTFARHLHYILRIPEAVEIGQMSAQLSPANRILIRETCYVPSHHKRESLRLKSVWDMLCTTPRRVCEENPESDLFIRDQLDLGSHVLRRGNDG